VKRANKKQVKASGRIVIEKNVPLPARGWAVKIVREMKVGDSVVLPDRLAAANLRRAAMRASVKLAERVQPDRRLRVWRVK
jgi:hypothetical protein